MKRVASKGIVLTVLAVLGMSGQAAAFTTPVPIPTRRTGSTGAAHVANVQAHAATQLEERP